MVPVGINLSKINENICPDKDKYTVMCIKLREYRISF